MTPGISTALLADAAKPGGSPLEKPEFIWGTAALAGALLVGAIVVLLVDRWRKHAALEEKRSGEELTSFRAMYERGEITEEEYNRVRRRVADRVKKPPAPGAAPPAGAAAPPESGNGTKPAAADPTAGQPPRPPTPGYFTDEAETPPKPWDRGTNGTPPTA
jgi:hypothetical protein